MDRINGIRNGSKKQKRSMTEAELVPTIQMIYHAFDPSQLLEELQTKISGITDHDAVMQAGKKVVELKEISTTIRSKIEVIRELMPMFLNIKRDTETIISTALENMTATESSEEEEVTRPAQNGRSRFHLSDESSEEELPEHLRNIEEPVPDPMVPFSCGNQFITSTPIVRPGQNGTRGPHKGWEREKQKGSRLPGPAQRTSRVSSSEISAIQAVKSLETLVIPSYSQGPRPLIPSATATSSSQVKKPLHEPSRDELIIVTYDHPCRKNVECPYCKATFMSRQTLITHTRDKHLKYFEMYEKVDRLYQSRNQLLQPSRGSKLNESSSKRTKNCSVCDQPFSRDMLLEHCRSDHIFEINNFIWIMNIIDASNTWREFFMNIQGTDIEAEKERCTALKKSNLKATESVVPKEPYDKLRTKVGIKRSKLPEDGLSDPATEVVKQSLKKIKRSTSRGPQESQTKENKPKRPPSKNDLTNRPETPKRKKKASNEPSSATKTVNLQTFQVSLINCEQIDLDKEPKEYIPPPDGTKFWIQCDKCHKKYLKPMEIAIHRIKFCKFRKPNPFTSVQSSSQGPGDPGPSNRDGGGANGDRQVIGSKLSSKPGTNHVLSGCSSNNKSSASDVVEDVGTKDVDQDEEEPIEHFVSPDSTSEPKSRTTIEVAPPSESSHSQSDHDEDEDNRKSLCFTKDNLVKVGSVPDYDYLVGECINNDISIEVMLTEINENEICTKRQRKMMKIFSDREPKSPKVLTASDQDSRMTKEVDLAEPEYADDSLIPVGSEIELRLNFK